MSSGPKILKICGDMKKWLLRILVSLVIFGGLDFVTGLFLIPESFNAFRTKHGYYHHGMLPNQSTMAAWGALVYPLHTNSLGCIDSAVRRISPDCNDRRLLILGDSHSEGVGVPYLKTFAGRLAHSLRPFGIEVINGSAVSYSPKIEYLKARYLVKHRKLEVNEILVMIDISDMQNELVYEAFEPDPGSGPAELLDRFRSRMKRTSAIWYLADAIRTGREREEFFSNIDHFYDDVRENQNNNIWELYSGFFSHFNNEVLLSNPQFHGMGGWMEDKDFRQLALKGITLGQQQIMNLRDLCDRHGIALTISVHPWHHQIEKGEIQDEYVRLWEEFAGSEEIRFVNMFPLFINGEEPETVIRKYYIADDNHWNEFGHERVAGFLHDYYTARGKE
jgi:hypothetical protein